jgi:hypothetical protein
MIDVPHRPDVEMRLVPLELLLGHRWTPSVLLVWWWWWLDG